MVATRTRIQYKGPATVQLAQRARLVAADARNWTLEVLAASKTKDGVERLAWKRLGFYATTPAGLRAALRAAADAAFRIGAGEQATIQGWVSEVDATLARLEAFVASLGAPVRVEPGRRSPEADAISEAVEAATRVVDGRVETKPERLVVELRARGLRLVADWTESG